MSRSRRHTPICGTACATSDRIWKRFWHRGYRHLVRRQVHQHQEPLRIREYPPANVWLSQKDGKRWFGGRRRPNVWRILEQGSLERYQGYWQQQTARMLRK